MLRVFQYEKLQTADRFFMQDSDLNKANIMAAFVIEEFNFEEMKNFIWSKGKPIHKF